jgi:hypothetical protein
MQMSKKNVEIFRDVMQIIMYIIYDVIWNPLMGLGEVIQHLKSGMKTRTMEQLAAGNVKAIFF